MIATCPRCGATCGERWLVYRSTPGHVLPGLYKNFFFAVGLARHWSKRTGTTYCVRRVQR